MKNKELQELNSIYTLKSDLSTNDDISLVDLAVILIRHKIMISMIFIIIVALSVVLAITKPNTYTYTASIEIGSQFISGSVKRFESPQTLLAKLNHGFIPQVLNELQLSSPDNKKRYNIKVNIPKNSQIIVLELTSTSDQADAKKEILQKIISKALQDHKRIYDAVKRNYISLSEQAKADLAAQNTTNKLSPDEIKYIKNKIESYKLHLANLQPTREILSPIKSLGPTGGNKKMIVIISATFGIFLAVFIALFAEFSTKVKEQIISKDCKHN